MTEPVPRTAALIVNTQSRKGRRLFKQARERLEAAGVELRSAEAVRDPKALPGRVRAAVEAGAPMVIVGGGDGTLSCAVDFLVGRETVLGVLPLGTANSFARTLGLPLDLAGAVHVIARGRVRRLDLGMIDGDYFANCATIGIAPQIAATVPHRLKAWLGRPGYLLWAGYQLSRFRAFEVTIEQGDTSESFEAVEVRVANGPYHGGVEIVDEARPDSGRIVVQAVIGETRRTLVKSWLAAFLRLPARQRQTRVFQGEAIRIHTQPPLPLSIDGEVLAKTPVTASVARRALRVAAPAPDQAAGR